MDYSMRVSRVWFGLPHLEKIRDAAVTDFFDYFYM
jgi:hypothetical protein